MIEEAFVKIEKILNANSLYVPLKSKLFCLIFDSKLSRSHCITIVFLTMVCKQNLNFYPGNLIECTSLFQELYFEHVLFAYWKCLFLPKYTLNYYNISSKNENAIFLKEGLRCHKIFFV